MNDLFKPSHWFSNSDWIPKLFHLSLFNYCCIYQELYLRGTCFCIYLMSYLPIVICNCCCTYPLLYFQLPVIVFTCCYITCTLTIVFAFSDVLFTCNPVCCCKLYLPVGVRNWTVCKSLLWDIAGTLSQTHAPCGRLSTPIPHGSK